MINLQQIIRNLVCLIGTSTKADFSSFRGRDFTTWGRHKFILESI
jgi:hypothetical protein